MRIIRYFLFFFILNLFFVVHAQDDICPAIVDEALEVVDTDCSDLDRNTACYGNLLINAVAQSDVEILEFESPGDITDLANIQSLELSPMDVEENMWGVAVMSIQANLPDTNPGQNVVFLMFGDVEIENAGDAMEAFYFRSGIGDAECNEAPNSGILIRTPEGVGEINLTVNEVEIALGSTAYLTAEADDVLTVALLDGQAIVEAQEESQTVETGFFVTVPIDENLSADGVPSEPQPIPEDNDSALPVASLPANTDSSEANADSNESSGEVAANSGDEIIPFSGTWLFNVTDISSVGGGCFPEVDAQIAAAMEEIVIPDAQFDEGFTLEEALGSAPLVEGTTFSHPETNLHIMEISQNGSYLRYEFRIMSEILITGAYVIDNTGLGSDCVTTMSYEMTYSE